MNLDTIYIAKYSFNIISSALQNALFYIRNMQVYHEQYNQNELMFYFHDMHKMFIVIKLNITNFITKNYY